jgi:hypothetical protein
MSIRMHALGCIDGVPPLPFSSVPFIIRLVL